MKQRFYIVDGVVIKTNQMIWEVIEDDGRSTSHGYYSDKNEAQNIASNLNRIYEEKLKNENNGNS